MEKYYMSLLVMLHVKRENIEKNKIMSTHGQRYFNMHKVFYITKKNYEYFKSLKNYLF